MNSGSETQASAVASRKSSLKERYELMLFLRYSAFSLAISSSVNSTVFLSFISSACSAGIYADWFILHSIFFVVQDLAGNFSSSELLNIVVDTEAPNTPYLDLLAASDTGRSDEDNITFDTTPAEAWRDAATRRGHRASRRWVSDCSGGSPQACVSQREVTRFRCLEPQGSPNFRRLHLARRFGGRRALGSIHWSLSGD